MKKGVLTLFLVGLSVSAFSDYYICYGSFGYRENAFTEVSALKEAGIEATVSRFDVSGKTLYRVVHPKGYADRDSAKWKLRYILAGLDREYPNQNTFWVFENSNPLTIVTDETVPAATAEEAIDEAAGEAAEAVLVEAAAEEEAAEEAIDEAVGEAAEEVSIEAAAEEEAAEEAIDEAADEAAEAVSVEAATEEAIDEAADEVTEEVSVEAAAEEEAAEEAIDEAAGEVTEEVSVEEAAEEEAAEEAIDEAADEVTEEVSVEEAAEEEEAEEAIDEAVGEAMEEVSVEEATEEAIDEAAGEAAEAVSVEAAAEESTEEVSVEAAAVEVSGETISFSLKDRSVVKTLFDAPADVYAVIPSILTDGKEAVYFTINLYRDKQRIGSKTGDLVSDLNFFSIADEFPEASMGSFDQTCEYTVELIFGGEVLAESSFLYFNG